MIVKKLIKKKFTNLSIFYGKNKRILSDIVSEKRVVGIRGLDLQIYEQIQELARKKNDNVANIINDALKRYLLNSDDVVYTAPQIISGQSKFEVTAEALRQLTPLRIEDVNTVIILDDTNEITTEMIDKDLESISRVEKIYVPNRLYYIILFSNFLTEFVFQLNH